MWICEATKAFFWDVTIRDSISPFLPQSPSSAPPGDFMVTLPDLKQTSYILISLDFFIYYTK